MTDDPVKICSITLGDHGLYAGKSVFLPVLLDSRTARDVRRMNDRQHAYWRRKLIETARALPFGAKCRPASGSPTDAGFGTDVTVTPDADVWAKGVADPNVMVLSFLTLTDIPLTDFAVGYALGLLGDDDMQQANIVAVTLSAETYDRKQVEQQG